MRLRNAIALEREEWSIWFEQYLELVNCKGGYSGSFLFSGRWWHQIQGSIHGQGASSSGRGHCIKEELSSYILSRNVWKSPVSLHSAVIV